tara:strand:- start:1283 stop:1648 length:366 start_codon:yes stop_codon:yes gene_type:complete
MEYVAAILFVVCVALAGAHGKTGKVMYARLDAGSMMPPPSTLMSAARMVILLATPALFASVAWACLRGPFAWWWFVPVGVIAGGFLSVFAFRHVVYSGSAWAVLVLGILEIAGAVGLWAFF